MGQIFHSCAYDIETKTCCVYDADKFHANCYAHSGAVFSMHYLLRQKPYNIMWGGKYVTLEDYSWGIYKNILDFIERPQDLLGLSTYLDSDDFEMDDEDLANKSFYKYVKRICEHNKLWKRIDVWDKAKEYFNWKSTHSVKYSGYLLNHTKKLAVDIKDYYKQSKALNQSKRDVTIDLLPVLSKFGTDKHGYILKNKEGEKYQCVEYNVLQQRGPVRYVKVAEDEKGVNFVAEVAHKKPSETIL